MVGFIIIKIDKFFSRSGLANIYVVGGVIAGPSTWSMRIDSLIVPYIIASGNLPVDAASRRLIVHTTD